MQGDGEGSRGPKRTRRRRVGEGWKGEGREGEVHWAEREAESCVGGHRERGKKDNPSVGGAEVKIIGKDLLPHIGIGTNYVVIPEIDRRYCASPPPIDQVPC